MHVAWRPTGCGVWWGLALTGILATPVSAQVRYDTPTGRVEILGLERWTRRMLDDSIAHYAPGETVASAACMAILRYQLKFGDALVAHYRGYDGPSSTREFLSVRVVEPSRARTLWRVLPKDTYSSLLPDYAPLILPVTDTSGGIWTGRLLYGWQIGDSATRARVLARADSTKRTDYVRVTDFLGARRRELDRQRALRVLDSSAAPGNRMAAAAILTSFPAQDSTWYALVRALRDPDEGVRGMAATALTLLPARPIDWAPATADLRALLGGANLGAMEPLMELLVQTSVSPKLVRPLLRGNEQWTMRLLTAEAPMAARRAQALLVAFASGTDLGRAPGPWRAWIASR